MDHLVGPQCYHKCPHKREAEGDLTTQRKKAMEAERLDAKLLLLNKEEEP